MIRTRYSRTSRHDQPSEESQPDRLRCSICGFPGVSVDTEPGENFPTAYTVSGSTYVWTSPAEAVTTLDKTVTPVPNTSTSCNFCGGTRFLDGSRGSGNAVP